MKYYFGIIGFLLACSVKQQDAAKSVQWYGQSFELADQLPETNLKLLMNSDSAANVLFSGEILDVCDVKGCWMIIKTEDAGDMRVTFKDYGFFVPMEGIVGKTAVIKGDCKKQETSVEDLRHYAQDAGKLEQEIAKITDPKVEFAFVASGVGIFE